MQRLWDVKTKVIPVTLDETGPNSKSLRKYMNNVMGKQEIKEHRHNGH
jgi:hypothetical protein